MTTSDQVFATEASAELTAWVQQHSTQIAADLRASSANPADAWRRLQDFMNREGADEALLTEVRLLAPSAAPHPSNVVLHPDENDAEIRARTVTPAGILPYPDTDTHVIDHGGGVLATPRVFTIYMGNDWGDRQHGLNARANQMTATLDDLFRDDHYWPLLSEYGSGNPQLVGTAFHDYPNATSFYDGDPSQFGVGFILPPGGSVSALITHIVESNPAVNVHPATNETNLLYFLFLSSNHAVYQPASPKHYQCGQGTGNSLCGYHEAAHYHKDILGIPFGGPNLFYAVGCPGISTGGITHELVEAFSDRDVSSGWFSADSEIGDICNRCTEGVVVTEGGIAAASFWLASQNRCVQQYDVTPIEPVVVTFSPSTPKFDQDIDLTVHSANDEGEPVPGTVILQNPCQPNPITFPTDVATRVRLCRVPVSALLPRRPNGFPPPPPRFHHPVVTVVPNSSLYSRGSTMIVG